MYKKGDPVHFRGQLLESLQPELEKWSGVPLKRGRAYGVRVYQNYSTLVLHVDKPETHVISCIVRHRAPEPLRLARACAPVPSARRPGAWQVHIGHDLDEPWPLQIEDHNGEWHEHELQVRTEV